MSWFNQTWAIVFAVAWVVVAIWLLNDVYDQHGPEGCLVFALIYFLLAPLFPLVAIGYLVLRAIAYGGPARPRGRDEERMTQYNWRTGGGAAGERGKRYAPPGGPISAAESDEELDLLLAEGRFRQALEQAKDKLELAQSFGDPAGTAKYRKYVDFIRLRAAKR